MEATNLITVHNRTHQMTKDDVMVWYDDDNTPITVSETYFEEELEFFRIRLAQNVEVGRTIKVFIHYATPLTNDDVGLYYSRYYQDGQLKWVLAWGQKKKYIYIYIM